MALLPHSQRLLLHALIQEEVTTPTDGTRQQRRTQALVQPHKSLVLDDVAQRRCNGRSLLPPRQYPIGRFLVHLHPYFDQVQRKE